MCASPFHGADCALGECGLGESYEYVSAEDMWTCTPCPIKKYKDALGNVQCTTCPGGSVTTTEGANSSDACICGVGYHRTVAGMCVNCKPGEAWNDVVKVCLKCVAGEKWQSESGIHTCEACEPGTVSNTPGSKSCERCEAGRYSQGTSCLLCNTGRYSLRGDSACTTCPIDSQGDPVCSSKGLLMLPDDAWWPEVKEIRTDSAVEQATQRLDGNLTVFSCFCGGSACVAGNGMPGNGTPATATSLKPPTCAPGHAQGSPLCAVCNMSAGWVRSGTCCIECPAPGWSWLMTLAVVGLLVAFIVHTALYKSVDSNEKKVVIMTRVSINYLQSLGSLSLFQANGTKLFRDLLNIGTCFLIQVIVLLVMMRSSTYSTIRPPPHSLCLQWTRRRRHHRSASTPHDASQTPVISDHL